MSMTPNQSLEPAPIAPSVPHSRLTSHVRRGSVLVIKHQMIELADTTVRAYKKKNGFISLHLRSFLLVHTNAGFRLDAYLKDIRCWIGLPGRKEQAFDLVSFSEAPACKVDQGIMAHDLRLSTIIPTRSVHRCIADFRTMYHISFTGHETEEPQTMKRKVMVIPHFR